MKILLVIIILLVVWAISSYNGFVRLDNSIEEAFATMDVYLKKRADLIPNLVEIVKGYAKYESGTLDAVIQARNAAQNATSTNDKINYENQVTSGLAKIVALAEAYPDLKANTNFQELMKQLSSIENDVANARKYYNAVVKNYNVKLQSFPSSVIGSIFHYSKKAMFEADDTDRASVMVDFSDVAPAPAAAQVAAEVAAEAVQSEPPTEG
ncbi:MAG: LemA family protein [Mogibacterium sp.]|nr:LemA family protein [Mogibacterium sp.]